MNQFIQLRPIIAHISHYHQWSRARQMYLTLLLFALLGACQSKENPQQAQVNLTLHGQSVQAMVATTPDGRKVKLLKNGTWQFLSSDIAHTPAPNTKPSLSPDEEVRQKLELTLIDKSYQSPFDSQVGSPESLKQYNIYQFKLRNPTAHAIKALKGSITITDIFDEKLSSFSFNLVEDIQPNQTIDWSIKVEIDRFSANARIQDKSLKDLKAKLKVKRVLFP